MNAPLAFYIDGRGRFDAKRGGVGDSGGPVFSIDSKSKVLAAGIIIGATCQRTSRPEYADRLMFIDINAELLYHSCALVIQ